ncbi:MAG: hypothetical protein ACRDLK_12245 [Gaiellaceae bacterium]
MEAQVQTETLLALSSGFVVAASDGEVGVVETPLFPPDETAPDFLVLRVGRLHPRRPVLAAALVESVDLRRRLVRVHASKRDILDLPEHLPLAI